LLTKSFIFITIQRMTKTVTTYNILKNHILSNQILPGERIYLENLSGKLNISVTPLREALNRLVQEGLIYHDSHRGYRIRIIKTSEVEQLYEFCEALETHAIKLSVQRITPSDLNELKENLVRYKNSIEKEYSRERLAINLEFHLKIAKISRNDLIVQNLEKAFEMLVWIWKLENLMLGRGPEAYDEHMAVYNSLERGDVTSAVSDLHNHIINTKKTVLRILSEKEALFEKE
jgi:DNA-binding GntR family transcriptional regulator